MKTSIYLLVFTFFLSFKLLAQPLSGVYSIGGTNPNYVTINDAITAVTVNGITGPVIFNIRSGIYNEHIILTPIAGSSVIKTVTFQSETGNEEDVLITHLHADATISENNTIYINGADNIFLKNLTIETQYTEGVPSMFTFSRTVHITNDANNIHIEGSTINSFSIGDVYQTEYSAILVDYNIPPNGIPNDCDSIFILNNKINGGTWGVAIFGNQATATYRWVENNILRDQEYGGINCDGFNQATIIKNDIEQIPSPDIYGDGFLGISVNNGEKSVLVSQNKIRVRQGRSGIQAYNLFSTNNYSRIISNNYILISNPFSILYSYGIHLLAVEDLLIAHNTVVVDKPQTTSGVACICFNGAVGSELYNNIFIRENGAYSYYGVYDSNITTQNNCHFSASNSPIARIDNTIYTNLAQIQVTLNLDMNSLDTNPYLSGTPPIVPSNLQLFASGVSVPTVTQDYFGTVRPTTPCIGSFEGTIPLINVGISSLNLLNMPVCPDQSHAVKIRISNYGSGPLTTAQIHFNGYVYPWVGNLTTNQESSDIDLGNYFVPRSLTHQLPPISVHYPNGQQDQLSWNDTITPILRPSLTGNYHIGGTTPDFTSLAEASSYLSSNGVCEDVFIKLAPGTYSEAVTFQNINGLSSTSSVTITSENGDSSSVILNGTNPTIVLNNLSHFNIKNIGIIGTNTSIGDNFITINSGHHINISNNQIVNGGIVLNSGNYSTDHITIKSNSINNSFSSVNQTSCKQNVRIDGSITNPITDVEIADNVVVGQSQVDVMADNVDNLVIKRNSFSGTRYPNAIDLDSCGHFEIYKNKFNTQATRIIGMYKCISALSNPSIIHTNMILGINLSTGIILQSCSNLGIYSNTVKTGDRGVIFSLDNSGIKFRNNIVHSTSARPIFYSGAPAVNAVESSHNNYYYNSPTALPITVTSTNYTLVNFQTAFNQDSNSVYAIPVFVSATDLHLNNSVPQDGIGTQIPGISDDIDGQTIGIYSDIGADQHDLNMTLFDYNIKIVEILNPSPINCQSDNALKIRITNVSDEVINYFTVKWSLFGTQMNQFVVNELLLPSDTIDVPLGNYSFNNNTLYNLKFDISLPNNVIDQYYPDNTINLSYSKSTDFEIESRQFEDCSTDRELSIPQFQRNSILWSTGATTDSIVVSSPGTYSLTIQFEGGCSLTRNITIN